ncbi:ATP synthase F1 subunit gamma [bacterium]|nr:ATP synthase F1 subunit gamma [bacterium]
MTNLKNIKKRIQSVESTKKITRAMKMVASAKVKKAELTVKASRPFTESLNEIFKKMLSYVSDFSSSTLRIKSPIDNYPALLKVREVKAVGLLVNTSNKGLAGAYNSNVVKKTMAKVKEYSSRGIKSYLFIVGQKGIVSLKRKVADYDCEIVKTYLAVANKPTPEGAKLVTEDLADYFVNGKIDSIEIITTRFKNMMSYFIEDWKVLPLKSLSEDHDKLYDGVIDPLMEFEPDKHHILQKIVPMYITNIIYQSLLEAQASELASRMTAMSAATSNAENMISKLSLEYNKLRQSAITNEIVEVVAGANAQKN